MRQKGLKLAKSKQTNKDFKEQKGRWIRKPKENTVTGRKMTQPE
jgi:hypothetical protein